MQTPDASKHACATGDHQPGPTLWVPAASRTASVGSKKVLLGAKPSFPPVRKTGRCRGHTSGQRAVWKRLSAHKSLTTPSQLGMLGMPLEGPSMPQLPAQASGLDLGPGRHFVPPGVSLQLTPAAGPVRTQHEPHSPVSAFSTQHIKSYKRE